MEKICEVYQKRSSLTLYLFQCLLFLGVGYIFLTYSDLFSYDCSLREFRKCCFENPILYQVIGKGLITYFGLVSLGIIGYLIKPLRLFYISDEGLWTRNFGFVYWQNISEVFLSNVACIRTVSFKVKNIEALNLSFQYKIIYAINKTFAVSGLPIDFAGNDEKVDEAFKLLKERVPDENK